MRFKVLFLIFFLIFVSNQLHAYVLKENNPDFILNKITVVSKQNTTALFVLTEGNLEYYSGKSTGDVVVQLANNPSIYYLKINNKMNDILLAGDKTFYSKTLPVPVLTQVSSLKDLTAELNSIGKSVFHQKNLEENLFEELQYFYDYYTNAYSKSLVNPSPTTNVFYLTNDDLISKNNAKYSDQFINYYYSYLLQAFKTVDVMLHESPPQILETDVNKIKSKISSLFSSTNEIDVSDQTPVVDYSINLPYAYNVFSKNFKLQLIPLGTNLASKVILTVERKPFYTQLKINVNSQNSLKTLNEQYYLNFKSESFMLQVKDSTGKQVAKTVFLIVNQGNTLDDLQNTVQGDNPDVELDQEIVVQPPEQQEEEAIPQPVDLNSIIPSTVKNPQLCKQQITQLFQLASQCVGKVPYNKKRSAICKGIYGSVKLGRSDCSGFTTSLLQKINVPGMSLLTTKTLLSIATSNSEDWEIMPILKSSKELSDVFIQQNFLPGDILLYGTYTKVKRGKTISIRQNPTHAVFYAGTLANQFCSTCDYGIRTKLDETTFKGLNNQGKNCGAKGNICWRDMDSTNRKILMRIRTIPACLSA